MKTKVLGRAALLVVQSTEWLALILLLVMTIPPVLIRHRCLLLLPSFNPLDDSWILDTTYKATGGIWFGRDVVFTYGPLFQWLSSAPTRWVGLSIGAVKATWYTVPLWVIVLSTFSTARLLLPRAAAWRRALFLLLAVVFWFRPDLRVALFLLAFAIFVRLTDRVGVLALPLLSAVAAAAICIAAFLVSADTGMYSTAAFVLCVAGSMVEGGDIRRLTKFFLSTAVCFGVLVLVTNTFVSSPLHFKFWRASLEIVTAYRWFEAIPMLKQYKRLVLETLAMGIAVFGMAWWRRRSDGPWTRRPAFLLSGFCMAFLTMQSSLVRSDDGHVFFGIAAMLALCGAIALDNTGLRWLDIVLPVAVTVATLVLAQPSPRFLPRDVPLHFRQIQHPVLSCPQELQQYDGACISPSDAQSLKSISAYTDSHTRPGEWIAIFPFETALGLASRRQVAGGVLQSYLVNGPYLTRLELSGLRQSSPRFALYLPDGWSFALDGVPNFTRSPDVWFYLLRHYRAEGSPVLGALGLVRDDSRAASLGFAEQKIAEPIGKVPVQKRNTSVNLGAIHWPAAGADFVKLRLQVNYPPWWRLRKPSCLTLQMSFVNGSEKSIQFVIQPNHATDIWVYPWNDQEMGGYFSANEADWPREGRSPLTRLSLLVTPFDWISVVPSSVSVEGVAAVRLDLK